MPDKLGSSVEVISSARAHRIQRRTATWAGGRVADSILRRTVPEAVELEDGRSKSQVEKAEEADKLGSSVEVISSACAHRM
jgi:hypothetical protein